MFVAVFAFIIIVFVGIGYAICKASKNRGLDTISMKSTFNVTELPRQRRKVLREQLPKYCENCGGSLKYNNVIWTGPRQAECPYCGHPVYLEIVESTVTE